MRAFQSPCHIVGFSDGRIRLGESVILVAGCVFAPRGWLAVDVIGGQSGDLALGEREAGVGAQGHFLQADTGGAGDCAGKADGFKGCTAECAPLG